MAQHRARTLDEIDASISDQVKKYPQKPLVDTSAVEHLVMTDHVIERCVDRGIGILEVYSAIAEPDAQWVGNSGEVNYMRGDLRATVNHKRRSIPTVIDLLEEHRTQPRVPLNPISAPPRKGHHVAAKKGGNGFDEAWVLMPHAVPEYREIEISPALAPKILDLNVSNRPLRRSDVEEWKRKIAIGEFATTHQGMAMDSTPGLQDGQHRLTAIAEGETSVRVWMLVGADPAVFSKIDAGRNRTPADVLALMGESDAFALGALIRLVYLYNNTSGKGGRFSNVRVTNAMVLEQFTTDADNYRRALVVGRRMLAGQCPMSRTAASAGYYLMCKGNKRAVVDDFFEGMITGVGLSHGDSRLALRRLVSNTKDGRSRTTAMEQLAWLLKTWEYWITGRTDRVVLTWRKDEALPRVAKSERIR
jgi:hypothetical protein